MYRQLEELVKNKKVLILGFGREGKSTYNVIKNFDCKIGISDLNDVSFEADVEFIIGNDYQNAINEYDIVFKSPGIVLEDKSDNVLCKITSQTDQMIKRFKNQIIGITGTKGKSTVTTLIYHVLKNSVGNCVLMGNIGIPAFDMIDEINDKTTIVYELSCHQLEYAPYSPHTSVLLNIFEEHLDHYGTFEKYADSKRNVYNNQTSDDVLVCSLNDCPDKKYNSGNLTTVSMNEDLKADLYLKSDRICGFDQDILFSELESNLLGVHNMYNIAVAYSVCKRFGVDLQSFKEQLKTYVPLPHRLEFVGEFDGVKYYDDSISTISETTIQALSSLENVGTLIIGGMDRGICYKPLVDFLKTYTLDNIVFMYDTGKIIYNKIVSEFSEDFRNKNLVLVDDLKSAVEESKKLTKKGKCCLMSPAAASYGFFKNFEDRGDKFKEYVKA